MPTSITIHQNHKPPTHHHHRSPSIPHPVLGKMMPSSVDLGLGLSLGLGLASQGSLSSSITTNTAASSSPASHWNAALSSVVGAAGRDAYQQGRTSTSPESGVALSSGSGSKRGLERTGSGVSRGGGGAAAAGSDDEDGGDGAGGRKKLRLSKDQAAVLEECFKSHSTLNPKQKTALANRLGLRPRQVEVWFQNRRARTKLKQTEVDCEYMKRWCEQLVEQNKRLEKEVAELRALKAAAPSPAQPSSATLTMCPSCRRVVTAGATAPPPNQQCHPKSNVPTAAPASAAAGNVLPSHCQFFPATADRARQSTWNPATPLVTRELF